MKNYLIALGLILTLHAAARNNVNAPVSPSKPMTTRAGDCLLGNNKINLEINNVRAMLLNSGDLWWDRSKGRYGVPKLTQDQISQGVQQVIPLFAGAIWISGKKSGNLYLSAVTYSTSGRQFWPGPMAKDQVTISKSTCNKFDKFWTITDLEIDNHRNGLGTSDNILNWPGKDNAALKGKFYTDAEYTDGDLAPFCDVDGDGKYTPTGGDFPCIKSTNDPKKASYASQMIFWVINDIGNAHASPDADPIGLQMNCLAFSFLTSDELTNMTFYTYQLQNKSNAALEETYMSQFADTDLGNYNDDYVGCDTTRSMGFVVNADAFDEDGSQGVKGYLADVPILAIDFFEGPRKTTGELIGLSSFIYFKNGGGATLSDPSLASEYRMNQEGKMKNGQNFTSGGDCTGGTIPTKFCFPGNPNNPVPEWSMCSAGLTGGDYRFVQNSGPFTMMAGTSEIISIGVIFVQPPVGSYVGCKIDLDRFLVPADEKAQRLFDFGFKNEKGPDAPTLKIFESNNRLDVTIENLSNSNNFGENYNKGDIGIPVQVFPARVQDTTYKFEGYLIYQLRSPNSASTFTDLQNPANAVLIKAMDLNNNVVYPKNLVEKQGVYFPIDSLPFNNSGIVKQFAVTEDKFESEGQKFLVNNKAYYFTAIAVGYNNFLDTVPKPNKRQTKQYNISSNLVVYSATPHDESFYGYRKKAKIGDKIDVTRVTGQGHGNYFLDILEKDENDIVLNGSKDSLTYDGGSAPISVLVNDPYKLKNASFKLTIKDSIGATTNLFDKLMSFWELEINDPAAVGLQNPVVSESKIDRSSEQSIYATIANKLEPYGISVAASSIDSLGFAYTFPYILRDTFLRPTATYKPIGAEIKFKDSSKKWMSLLKNIPEADYTGWIKSGALNEINPISTQVAPNVRANSNFNFVRGKRVYTDTFSNYAKILDGRIAPYCLASNQYVTDAVTDANNYAAQGPAFKWKSLGSDRTIVAANGEGPENNLDKLFSVNVVITNDRNKWSKCVVLETGDVDIYNQGNARKGQMRKAESLDSSYNPIPGDTGRSYFPGYAINLETGQRVNIYFGENSAKTGQYAANMIWDPNPIVLTTLGSPILGNGHYVYVTNTPYDEGDADAAILAANFNKVTAPGSANPILDSNVAKIYRNFIWTFIPIGDTASFAKLYTGTGVYRIPNEVKIKIRVEKPYALYNDLAGNKTSEYIFNTSGKAPEANTVALTDSAFNNMRIVPNPYNAYSVYEQNSVQNIVKFVGVPKNSTITIMTLDGILVRKIKLGESAGDNYLGANITNGAINVDDSYNWDMRTSTGILISSGIYYVYVSSPTKGDKVMKLFATMRSVDLSNF